MAITKHVQHVKSNQTVTTTVDNVDVISPKLPSYNDLKDGEIAVNYHKGYETLSIRNDDNGIVTFPNSNAIADMQEVYITDILGGSLNDLTFGFMDGTSSSNLYSYTTSDFNDLKNAINNEKVVLFRFKNEGRIVVPIRYEYIPVGDFVATEYIHICLFEEPIETTPKYVNIQLYANKASNEANFFPYSGISLIDANETSTNVYAGTNYYTYYSQTSPLWTAIISDSTVIAVRLNGGGAVLMSVYDVDMANGIADMRGIYTKNNKIYIADGTLNTTDMEFNCTMTEYTSKVQSITTYQSSTPVAVNDTHDQAISKLIKIISDNETTTATALTDLNDNKVDTNDLADVAFSGDYDDLINKPTISDTYVCNLTNIADLVPFYEQNDSATQMGIYQGMAQVTAAEYNGIINAYNEGKKKFIFPYVSQYENINYIFEVVNYDQDSGILHLTMTDKENRFTVLMDIASEGIITQYSKYGRIISFSILPNTTGTFNCVWYGSALKKVYDTITCAVAMGGAVSIYVSDGGSNTNIATLDGVNIGYDQTSDSNILYLNGSYLGSNGKIYDLKLTLTDDDSGTNNEDILTVTERAEAPLMVEIEYVDDSWDSEGRSASYEVTTDISLEDLANYIKEGRNVIIRDVTEGTAYEDDNMDYTPPEYWNNVYVDYPNVLANYPAGFGAYNDIQHLYFWYDDNEDKIICDYYIDYSIDYMIQESATNVASQIEHEKYLNVTNYSVNASTGVITGTKSLVNTTDYTEITKIILKNSSLANEVYYLTKYSRNTLNGKTTLILESESGKTITCEVTTSTLGTQTATLTQTVKSYITGITLDSTAQTVSNGVVDLDLTEYGDNVWYDSTRKRIYLRHGSTNLNYIDATAFIKDGMVDTVTIGNGTGNNAGVTCLIITFNTDAGKSNIELPISQIFDANNYYTSSQVDDLLPSAGTGLTEDANHAFNHTNSVTANTNNVFKTFTYDAQGHVTAGTDASEIDFTVLESTTLSSSFLNRCATNYATGAQIADDGIDYDHTRSNVPYTTLPYRRVTPPPQNIQPKN